jgi:hypothetical protein
MDSKITLAFDEAIILKAKKYAEKHNISLSRLIEVLLEKITTDNYKSLEDFPVSDWVDAISEGKAKYITRTNSGKSQKKEYYERRKK